jgi:hypothetical protein
MRTFLSLLIGAVLLPSAAVGQTPFIYLTSSQCLNSYSDPMGVQLPGFQPVQVQIRGLANQGAQTFEFAIPGFTPAVGVFVLDFAPNPQASFASGNPFAEGARISFANCQTEPVLLYSATLFAAGVITVRWSVGPHSSPSVPGTTCGTATACGGGNAACLFASPPQVNPAPPHDPSPADGAVDVSLHPELSYLWTTSGMCTCASVPCTTLYFGENPDPPVFFSNCDVPFPELDLKPSTTYYWRVSVSFCGSVIGPVWSFTTQPPLGVQATTWGKVKQVFR